LGLELAPPTAARSAMKESELPLSDNEYLTLFRWRFFNYYNSTLREYPMSYIYPDMLRFIEDYSEYSTRDYSTYFVKYMALNDFISISFEDVAIIDDIELFKHIYRQEFKTNKTWGELLDYISGFMSSGSINILKYILDTSGVKELEDINGIFKGTVEYHHVDLKVIKLFIDYYNYSDEDLFFLAVDLHEDNTSAFNYILDNLGTLKSDVIYRGLSFYMEYHKSLYQFQKLWDNYKKELTHEHINSLFKLAKQFKDYGCDDKFYKFLKSELKYS